MLPFVQEWLNLAVRWAHIVAAIMWIGDSFLFMWLDTHLSAPTRPRDGAVVGELWMTHSGGFYEVIKRKSLAQNELPPVLFWFKWESYTTWLTGFLLLLIVFHTPNASLLVDTTVYPLEPWMASAISLGLLPLAYGVYELLWQTPLARHGRLFAGLGLGLITALAFALTNVFSARGAFLQVGATLGTIMSANVFFRIIPAQKHMLAMTREGRPVDTTYGLRAKGRSIQNHYLTLPVLFTMLSSHFPSTYGAKHPWLVLALLVVVGVGAKYVMNFRAKTPAPALVGALAALVAVVGLTRPLPDPALARYLDEAPVKFEAVASVLQLRCVSCHAKHPSSSMFASAPLGVMLESPDDIHTHAARIFARAVSTRTMPLGNLTGMTDEERTLLGAWYAQGAPTPTEAPVPSRSPTPTPAPPPAPAPAPMPGAPRTPGTPATPGSAP
jgi:uncharacterized membrane protein